MTSFDYFSFDKINDVKAIKQKSTVGFLSLEPISFNLSAESNPANTPNISVWGQCPRAFESSVPMVIWQSIL
jgi:hypothetical protein